MDRGGQWPKVRRTEHIIQGPTRVLFQWERHQGGLDTPKDPHPDPQWSELVEANSSSSRSGTFVSEPAPLSQARSTVAFVSLSELPGA